MHEVDGGKDLWKKERFVCSGKDKGLMATGVVDEK